MGQQTHCVLNSLHSSYPGKFHGMASLGITPPHNCLGGGGEHRLSRENDSEIATSTNVAGTFCTQGSQTFRLHALMLCSAGTESVWMGFNEGVTLPAELAWAQWVLPGKAVHG